MNRVSSREARIIARVRKAREAMGLNQAEIGQRLGLSKAGYGHYERGRQPLSIEQLFILSRVLMRSVEHFLGLDSDLNAEEDRLLAMFRSLRHAACREAVLMVVEDQMVLDQRLTREYGEPR